MTFMTERTCRSKFSHVRLIVFTATLLNATACLAQSPWSGEGVRDTPAMTWLDESSPVRSLLYQGQPYKGEPTDVFAFYATPGSVSGDTSRDKNLPAIVLIHGGGGTAFDEWVWLWAKRGYAAIAMDLSGRRPPAPRFDPETDELIVGRGRSVRERLARGGPEADHQSKFQNAGGEPSDDWQNHAVPAVIAAHSLIRSFKEVDAERTAVTGISWGGYLTCLVASVDERFKAAVPVYGCGFLYEGESVQKKMIDALEPAKREFWIAHYDPSAWLSKCRVPILFVNGTGDIHYPLNSYASSYALVEGPRQFRIEVDMRHSHIHGWKPKEIGLFVDQHLRGGKKLAEIGSPTKESDQATALVKSEVPLRQAHLHYTRDDGPLHQRRWQSVEAKIDNDRITARLPDDARIWMLSATDSRDAMTSSGVVFESP